VNANALLFAVDLDAFAAAAPLLQQCSYASMQCM